MAVLSFLDPAIVPFFSTFLFVFAVVFGLLSVAKIGFDKRVNAALAIAIAFFASIYEPLVTMLTQYMPIAIGLLIVIFFVVFIKKVLGGEGKDGDNLPILIAIGLLMLLLAMFSDRIVAVLPYGADPNMVLWGIGILFVILFFWFVYKQKN